MPEAAAPSIEDALHSGRSADLLARVQSTLGYSAAPSFSYMPALDGFRAFSVMIVLFSHIGFKSFIPGVFGVTVFFFISGFLITRQLLAEQADRGQIALGAFYVRRLIRLYPALLVMIVIGSACFIWWGGHISTGQVMAAVFYYTNYFERIGDYQGTPAGMYHPFGPLWSLAVEEHYYLVYPGLVFLIGVWRMRLLWVLVSVITAVTLWRLHIALECASAAQACIGDGQDLRILQSTDTRIDSILYGALLAVALGSRIAGPVMRLLQPRAVFGLGLLLLLTSFAYRAPLFRDSLRFTVQGIGLFLVVGGSLFSLRLAWVRRLLSLKPCLLLGRWSYSLYLWHSIVLLFVVAPFDPAGWEPALTYGMRDLEWDLIGAPITTVLSIAVAWLSYRYVETPMLALRRRFGSHAVRDSINTGQR